MIKGRSVIAHGKPGIITKMQEGHIDGVDYVYYIYVRLIYQKHSNPYHPGDVQEGEIKEVAP